RHDGIRDAAAVIRTDASDDAYLAAYVVAGRDGADTGVSTVDALRAHLRAELPEYMVPTRYVVLEELPRTANGKLDRRALPDPSPVARVAAAPAAPRTPTEAMVLEIFADVLRRPGVGAHESFFDVGGDSLMAARLMLRLRAACGYNVPLGLLFERQTAARLAEAVESLARVAPRARTQPASAPRERTEVPARSALTTPAALVPLQPRGSAPPIF